MARPRAGAHAGEALKKYGISRDSGQPPAAGHWMRQLLATGSQGFESDSAFLATAQPSHESLHVSEDIIWHGKSNAILGCLLNYILPASAESLRNL